MEERVEEWKKENNRLRNKEAEGGKPSNLEERVEESE